MAATLLVASTFGDAGWSAPRQAPSALRGRSIYERYCATCHGARGNGAGPSARRLGGPPPRDFTRGEYKFRSTATGSLPTRGDLMRTVWRGVPGSAMPAWRDVLDVGQIADVVSYVQTFSPKFAQAARDGDLPERVDVPKRAPRPSAAAEQRGRGLFLLMKCWSCHGLGGEGDGPDASKAEDSQHRPIRPRDLATGVFKNGGSPRAIYRTLATGFDGTPMAPVFDRPESMWAPLVLQRAQYRRDLDKVAGGLTSEDRVALRTFELGLPTERALRRMSDAEQQRLLVAWRWDLVFYLRSLSRGGAGWRAVLGL